MVISKTVVHVYVYKLYQMWVTMKPETLALLNLVRSDSKIFDKRNVDEMLVKALIFVLYFAWWLYFERFDDFTPICQIGQSFHSSSFW